jgi:hypothetical protein
MADDDEAPDNRMRLAIVLANHPPMPTDRLRERLGSLAAVHTTVEDDEDLPTVEVTICILISLLREVLQYRNRYGLIELPGED